MFRRILRALVAMVCEPVSVGEECAAVAVSLSLIARGWAL
jgi:hypothetical protein